MEANKPEDLVTATEEHELMEKLAARPLPELIEKKTHELIIRTGSHNQNVRKFTLYSMGGQELTDWTAMQMMRIWRMIEKAREMSSLVVQMGYTLADHPAPEEIDQQLQAKSETLFAYSNVMVYEALGLEKNEESSQFKRDCDFVRSLSNDQKEAILSIQDTLNAQEFIAAVMNADREKRNAAYTDHLEQMELDRIAREALSTANREIQPTPPETP